MGLAWTADVVEVHSRWTDDRSAIVSRVRTTDGVERDVLGGHVDGITMQVFHGTAPYVQTTTGTGAPLRWAKRCVLITAAAEGTTAVDDEAGALAIARAAWAGQSCSYLELVDAGSAEGAEVGLDGVNLVKYRDVRWCRPASHGNPERCYDEGAVAITTVFYIDDETNPRNGEILDADIELNNVNYRLTVGGVGTGTALCDADIAATLTHELGHVMGFDHVCHSGFEPPAVDHTGAPVPMCLGNTDPAILEATMYPFQDCGETKKVTPEADDLAALCGVYPIAADPGVCAAPDPLPPPPAVDAGLDAPLATYDESAGCCDARSNGASGVAVSLVTLTLLALRSRPRRRRSDDTVGPCAPV